MKKKVFKADLSISRINDLKKQLIHYRDVDLAKKAELIAEKLAQKGVEFAKVNVQRLDAVFTGELLASIKTRKGGSTKGTAIFYVVADSHHAAFVEFGTGQLGMEGGYPYPFPEGVDWEYNTGKTIFEISSGQYGWFYPGDDGKWYFTQGMPSRPFMYEASLQLQQAVIEVAKEVFK